MAGKGSNIRDVAKKAGVSITTVSKVLNKGGGISEGTTRRVEKAIRELKYIRSQAFAGRKTTRILVSLIIADVEIMNPYFLGILKGIYDTSGSYDCGIYMRVFAGYQDTGEGLLEDWPPIVFVDRTLDGVNASSVTVDNREGAYQAAKYLLKLGHTRLAYVGGQQALSSERDRMAGFNRALAESGLACRAENLLDGGFELQPARQAMEERLRRDRTFSAVFVG